MFTVDAADLVLDVGVRERCKKPNHGLGPECWMHDVACLHVLLVPVGRENPTPKELSLPRRSMQSKAEKALPVVDCVVEFPHEGHVDLVIAGGKGMKVPVDAR